ncbi:MAG TPA: HlyD family efflux transporter periplasmic adaptor subunit [Magnetospirillum sp.]|nr:HlyD family efflux transporter periplasmic adaptor subunit [Magnetospirillum sp.]
MTRVSLPLAARRMPRRRVLALAALVLVGLGWWLLGGPSHEAGPAAAGSGDVVARGRIEPLGRVLAIHGPAEGAVIQELLVDQGDKVKAGQPLAVLDGYDIRRAELAVAERNLRLAELQREQTVAGAKHADLAAQRNAVTAKSAQLVKLRLEWGRRNALYARQVVSAQSLDSLRAELEQAESEVSQANNVLKSLTETRGIDDTVAQARIEIERAGVERARVQLQHMLVRAPVGGTVLSLQARAGEAIGADGLLRMAALDPVIAVAEVDEAVAGKVVLGMDAVIEGQVLAQPVRARVTKLAQEVFRQKRPSSDILIGRDARIVEVELTPLEPLPEVLGAEVLVRLSPAMPSRAGAGG